MKTFHHVPIFLLLAFCFQIHQADAQKVKTETEVLQKNNFFLLKGKKVGLITNPTGIDRNLQSTVDIFHNCPDFELVALFGPEHGVRGDYGAGDYVENYTDPHTGLPVYSIYGKTRKPTREMLQGIDVLVYDIQDIGSRSYTYISTLGLAMEAAAENNIQFVVLDRPNPWEASKWKGCSPSLNSFPSSASFPFPMCTGPPWESWHFT